MYTSSLNSDILTALLLLLHDGYVQSVRLETDHVQDGADTGKHSFSIAKYFINT